MSDERNPEHIFLDPLCGHADDQRCWCVNPQDCPDCDDRAVKYVRDDIVADLRAQLVDAEATIGKLNGGEGAPVPQASALALVDWVYLHATEGEAWPSTKTANDLIAKAIAGKPTQADADAMKAAAKALQMVVDAAENGDEMAAISAAQVALTDEQGK